MDFSTDNNSTTQNDNSLSEDGYQDLASNIPPNTQGTDNSSTLPGSEIPTVFDEQIRTLPPEAGDVDLIEKEWVIHLKHIVDRTRDNPFVQQREISHAKADYLKKRYGKVIRQNES